MLWAMKSAIGVLSDALPICGYAKFPYMMITSVIGVSSLALLGTIRHGLEVTTVVNLLSMSTLFISSVDLLSEAAYAAKLKEQPKHGPMLLSYAWAGLNMGGSLAICVFWLRAFSRFDV